MAEKSWPLGAFLKNLRIKKGVSLRDVESKTGIPNAYLSQLETGERKKLPEPDRLNLLADYYSVSIQELLAQAGYLDSKDIKETYEEKIDGLFKYVTSKPDYRYGHRIKGDLTTEIKKFVIEMYEKISGEKLL